MENEKNQPGHEYDGIQEHDNDLPNWWRYTFYITIVFALGYMFHYHWGGTGDGQLQEYQKVIAAAELETSAKPQIKIPFTAEDFSKTEHNAGIISKGKEIFNTRCVSCHGIGGPGGIGPNLTDKFWIHGGKSYQIATTISEGVPEKGMIPWNAILTREEVVAVAIYVKSLSGTNPPNAKAPQGTKEDL